MTPTSPVVSEQRMEENLTGVYFWNKTLKPFAPCCQHLNLRVALKASPRRPNSQRPFEREPVLETVAEWDWRTGWRDAVLTQVVGRRWLYDVLRQMSMGAGDVTKWRWSFPRPDELLVFLCLLLLGHSSLWQVFAFVSAVCAVITEYPFISCICWSSKVKWVLFIWT